MLTFDKQDDALLGEVDWQMWKSKWESYRDKIFPRYKESRLAKVINKVKERIGSVTTKMKQARGVTVTPTVKAKDAGAEVGTNGIRAHGEPGKKLGLLKKLIRDDAFDPYVVKHMRANKLCLGKSKKSPTGSYLECDSTEPWM